ncbi:MAG TPA: protein kinase family protein [Terriglobales bacterium]|jgi:serine/threonine protein kinase|nr:protein kinase family protein [Terriglobales bacterium]
MKNDAEWERINSLGGGGQSDVFLVRSPARSYERTHCLEIIRTALDEDKRAELATAMWSYARPDNASELGALKVFKIPPEDSSNMPPIPKSPEYEAIERLKNEISALSKDTPGLPKLLDSNVEKRWIVTEFFSEGTLENNLSRYKGRAILALKAFRSLVKTVAGLHGEGYVHRDIKPANVFVRSDEELVLGDFGIVYLPNAGDRVTLTKERVGPRDYMPQWANLGGRHEKVEPCFDVYMLGKLLWCMVDGRAVLPREYHKRPDFDLTKTFPNDPHMHVINKILDKCVVEESHDCLSSADDLLLVVDAFLAVMQSGGQVLSPGIPRPCRICGQGFYKPEVLLDGKSAGAIRFWISGSDTANLMVQTFICDNCGHVELFRTSPGQVPLI